MTSQQRRRGIGRSVSLPPAPTAPTVLHSPPASVARSQSLSYVAPERLHEVKLDEAKVFVDVAPPSGKPKAVEEKKIGETSCATANHDDECVICLDALWGNGKLTSMVLKCGHRFHYDCIHEALKKCGGKCPLCRGAVWIVTPLANLSCWILLYIFLVVSLFLVGCYCEVTSGDTAGFLNSQSFIWAIGLPLFTYLSIA